MWHRPFFLRQASTLALEALQRIEQMRVFLTGATGLLGNNIARQLTDRGDKVIALVRSEPAPEVFAGVDVEFAYGDLFAKATIERAIERCDVVIHSAAMLHIGWHYLNESMRANRDGTQTVAEAARRAGKRMVHIGTVNTMAMPPQKSFGRRAAESLAVADEQTPLTPETEQVPCSYVISKRASVEVVSKQVENGLDACIVHPGFMLGPWDWKPSSGRMMLEIGRRPFVPAWPTGGCSVCDVRDVAAGTIAAIDKAATGRHYILAGENWTYRQLWKEMATRMGRPSPLLPIGPLVRAGASLCGHVVGRFTGVETDINGAAIKMASQKLWFDSSRARREIGYSNRHLSTTLDDAANWIQTRFLQHSL